MKALVAKRARITRVRSVQHKLALTAAASATAHVTTLESNAAKLATMRDSLTVAVGTTSGAALQNRGELAQRLDAARYGLTDAIVSARAAAERKLAEKIEARQRQESAARLDARAIQALAEWTETRMNAEFRPRGPRNIEQGTD